MSYRRSNFMETDDMFLQFEEDLDNIAGGSSSVGDNTGSSSQQTTPTPRRRAQSRLLELERHVAINGCIPMTIAPGAEKPISPHAIRFSQAIGVCVGKKTSENRFSRRRRCRRISRRRESLSRRISPDVVLYVEISFPDVLCIFADVFVRREYPRLL
uniref:CACTA en-spm transposon protein n=1 Tax=Cucumis melo TaxID=3656 RepID=A0A9I9E7H4_CUCME